MIKFNKVYINDNRLSSMSQDITPKSELVGVQFPAQVIAKIDERRSLTGATRQEIIRQAVINELF